MIADEDEDSSASISAVEDDASPSSTTSPLCTFLPRSSLRLAFFDSNHSFGEGTPLFSSPPFPHPKNSPLSLIFSYASLSAIVTPEPSAR